MPAFRFFIIYMQNAEGIFFFLFSFLFYTVQSAQILLASLLYFIIIDFFAALMQFSYITMVVVHNGFIALS